MIVDIVQALGTILLLGAPVWIGGTWFRTWWDARRIAGVLGQPSDPVTDRELQSALLSGRCGVRLWRELLVGIFRFDQPRVVYPWARLAVWPGSLAIRLPGSGDYRFRCDASRVDLAWWGVWLSCWGGYGHTALRLRLHVLGRRRKIVNALREAGWTLEAEPGRSCRPPRLSPRPQP